MAGDTRFILNKAVMVVYCWCIYKQADNITENFLFFLIKPFGYRRGETKNQSAPAKAFTATTQASFKNLQYSIYFTGIVGCRLMHVLILK